MSNTFLQPFVSYTTPTAWTFTVNSESSYDWKNKEWTVPFNFVVSKLTHFGQQPVSLAMGARYWADTPENGPHGWGARAVVSRSRLSAYLRRLIGLAWLNLKLWIYGPRAERSVAKFLST